MHKTYSFGLTIIFACCIGLSICAPASVNSGKDAVASDNIEERAGLFEGDIRLDPSRNGIIGDSYRWPQRTVIYEISTDFTSDERIRILTAWAELVNTTCIRFRQRADETNYVFIQKGDVGSGCFSDIGLTGGRQILNLEATCVPRHGTVVHEMIHTIGFYHEQSRPDRDDYVTVVWDKIQPGLEHNFNKYGYDVVTTFDTPYDYGSVMHYPAVGFSIDGSPTLIPHDPDATIGQRVGISRIDAHKINLMYECA